MKKYKILGENWIVAASTLSNYKNWFVLFGLPASFAFMFVIVAITKNTIVRRLDISTVIEILSLSKTNVLNILFLLVCIPVSIGTIFTFAYKIMETAVSLQYNSHVKDNNQWLGVGLVFIGVLLGIYLMFVTYKQTPVKNYLLEVFIMKRIWKVSLVTLMVLGLNISGVYATSK